MRKNEFASTITREEISQLPLKSFMGPITVVDTPEKAKSITRVLKRQRVLGFDTETKPTFRKGKFNEVALLQLATSTRAYLFRLNKIGLNGEITSILEDRNIQKIGAAIHDDIISLQKLYPFDPAGFVDLQQFVKSYDIESNGLKKLTAIVLKFRISKSQQTSNWENVELTEAQQIYAATDAWVCLKIFKRLNDTQNM